MTARFCFWFRRSENGQVSCYIFLDKQIKCEAMSQFLCLGTFLMFHCKTLCEIAPTRLLFICSRNDVLLTGYINVKSGFTFISLASNSQSFKICPDLFSSSVVQVQHSCGRACSMLLLWPSYPTIVTCGRFSPKLLLHIQS